MTIISTTALTTATTLQARSRDKRATMTRDDWQRELEKLMRMYETSRAHCADEILTAYAGLERELVQCYRHFYTGEGGFRVASETFSLPREAIDTFLRLKLRARRSNSFASKGDGMRDAELAASPVSTSRPRAASTSAVHMRP